MRGDFAGKSETEGAFARLIGLQADPRVNGFAQDGCGIFLSGFSDFHAAGRAGHENRKTGSAIDQKAEVKFALDVQTFFDEHTLDDAAARAGLRRHEIHAQDVAGDFGGFVAGARELDAATLTTTAGMNLGLDEDDVGFEALCRFARFLLGVSDFAARSGDAVARENRFGLILVNLHRASISARICASAKQRSLLGRRKRSKDAAKWPRTQLFF